MLLACSDDNALVALADALAGEVIFFIKVHVFCASISAIPSIKS